MKSNFPITLPDDRDQQLAFLEDVASLATDARFKRLVEQLKAHQKTIDVEARCETNDRRAGQLQGVGQTLDALFDLVEQATKTAITLKTGIEMQKMKTTEYPI